jgi:methionyl-tRNA formyltransferase
MKNVLYIEGGQGQQTLVEFLKYTTDIFVVLPEGYSNEAIVSTCLQNNINYTIRRKGVPIKIMDDTDLLLSSQFPYKIDPREYESVSNAINIHASILPSYKGTHSDVWSLINDEKILGVTAHRLNKYFDDGKVMHIEEFEINDSMDLNEIYQIASSKIPIIVSMIIDKTIFTSRKIKQYKDVNWRTRNLHDSIINWHLNSRKIFLFVRALSRPPIYAYSFYKRIKFNFLKIKLTEIKDGSLPGSVVKLNKEFFVVCGDSKLVKPIDVHSSGVSLEEGMVLH